MYKALNIASLFSGYLLQWEKDFSTNITDDQKKTIILQLSHASSKKYVFFKFHTLWHCTLLQAYWDIFFPSSKNIQGSTDPRNSWCMFHCTGEPIGQRKTLYSVYYPPPRRLYNILNTFCHNKLLFINHFPPAL